MLSSHEKQKARSFLFSHHRRGFGIPPQKFAGAAKELGVNFRELMSFISLQYSRGAQQSLTNQANLQRIAARGG